MAENLYSAEVQSTFEPQVQFVQSRYDRKTRIKLDNKNTTIIRALKSVDMIPEKTDGDSTYEVSAATQFRPDVIAFQHYGNPLLYWVVLSSNGLKSPFEVKQGMHLRLPSTAAIYGMNGLMVR